jgi:hypothetical protein
VSLRRKVPKEEEEEEKGKKGGREDVAEQSG